MEKSFNMEEFEENHHHHQQQSEVVDGVEIHENGSFLQDLTIGEDMLDLPTIISNDDSSHFTEDDSFTVDPPVGEENRFMEDGNEVGEFTSHHITSHDMTSHHITSHHITQHNIT